MAEFRYSMRGDVDIESAPRVRDELQTIVIASDAHVLVDCAGLTFIDSTGIALLLEAHRDLAEQRRHLLIVNVPPGPRRVFEILGLGDLLRYHRSIDSLA